MYYEAWEVKPGQREPSANVRGYTDASVGVTREGTCGKSRQDGVVRFYRRGMTGDLGSQDMVEDPGAADGSGLSARISPPQPGTGFEIERWTVPVFCRQPGLVQTGGLICQLDPRGDP